MCKLHSRWSFVSIWAIWTSIQSTLERATSPVAAAHLPSRFTLPYTFCHPSTWWMHSFTMGAGRQQSAMLSSRGMPHFSLKVHLPMWENLSPHLMFGSLGLQPKQVCPLNGILIGSSVFAQLTAVCRKYRHNTPLTYIMSNHNSRSVWSRQLAIRSSPTNMAAISRPVEWCHFDVILLKSTAAISVAAMFVGDHMTASTSLAAM